jgi:hypothetical protein
MRLLILPFFLFLLSTVGVGCEPPSAPDLCRRNCQVWATCNHLTGEDEARCVQTMACDHAADLSGNARCCLDHCFDQDCGEYLACEQICLSQ